MSGCGSKPKPSFIIVALDHFSFNSLSCSEEKSILNSGLGILCKEAFRFTHAYTTSVQPAAAMGSLLTGSYPYTHGLHRSFDRISSKQKLLSEVADAQGYRTSFFSGSPAIMKKTGLSKGFDLFEDLSFLEKKNYVNSFKFQSELALGWIGDGMKPFVTVIYNSELESLTDVESDITTFEKLDETLGNFFSTLKEKNLWESNYVIVLGLQGSSDYSRPNETVLSNLHSENTNVGLFIKPPRQKGDDGLSWKIDTVINTADLGWSLIKTIDENYLRPLDERFLTLDFSFLWKKDSQSPSEMPDRKILIETVNPWPQDIEPRYAILFGNLVYIENQNDELFNSLTDGLEMIDISSSATSTQNDFKNENRKILSALRALKNRNAWINFTTDLDDWVNSNRNYWSDPNSRPEILENEQKRFESNKIRQPLTALLVQNILTNGKQETLKKMKLKIDPNRTTADREAYFDEARRQSLNLALENLWGLWGKNKSWTQSTLIREYQ